jgi:DNA-binding SARP family transcriptional activator
MIPSAFSPVSQPNITIMAGLQAQLLGGFSLTFDKSPVPGFHQPRLQALLAYIVLNQQKPIARNTVAFLFWPDSTDKQARTNLRKLIYSMRKALPEPERYLALTTTTIAWRKEAPFTLDVDMFENSIPQTSGLGGTKPALRGAVAAYRGDLLPGLYDEWILVERERLRSLYAAALKRLTVLYEAERNYPMAVSTARRLLEFDAMQESTYRLLMRLHLLNNDRGAALAVYHQCSTILREELGVDPSPLTAELYNRVLQLDSAVSDAPRTTDSLPLIGRRREWHLLDTVWKKVQKRGPATLFLIQGEAGIGKTRLAEELVNKARRLGMTVLHTRAYGAEGAGPNAPIVDLLRAVGNEAILENVEPVWLTELARFLPELREERPDIPPRQPVTEAWQRQRFQEGLAKGVLAGGQPLLIHFDDLHWCDPETLAWLRFLLGYEREGRLLVVGTVRDDEVEFNHPLKNLRFDLEHKGRCRMVNLAPLNPEEVAQLAAEVVGQALSAEQIGRLLAESEGSPLFLIEMLRAGGVESAEADISEWLDDPVPVMNGERRLPSKVQAVIRWRLSQLSSEAHELAAAASVIGRRFQHDLLAFVGDMPEKELVRSLDELWRRRIIREEASADYDFNHDRLREVAYAQISPMRRRYLHKRTAQALEHLNADDLDPVSGRIAHHFEQAGISKKALLFFGRAGHYSVTQFAHEEAVRFFTKALAMLPPKETQAQYKLLVSRETSFDSLGNREAQADDLNTMESLAIKLGVDQQLHVARRQSNFYFWTVNYPEAKKAAQRLVNTAREAGNKIAESEGYFSLASALRYLGQHSEGVVAGDQALQLATLTDHTSIIARCLQVKSHDARSEGDFAKAIELRRQVLPLIRSTEDKVAEAFAIKFLADDLWVNGDFDEADNHFSEALELFQRIGYRRGERGVILSLAENARLLGDYLEAQMGYAEVMTMSKEIASADGESMALDSLGMIAFALGDTLKARQYTEQAIEIAQNSGFLQGHANALHNMACIYLAQGRIDLAGDYFEQALAIRQANGHLQNVVEDWAGLAEVALAQTAFDEVHDYLEGIFAQMEKNPTMGGAEHPMRVYTRCIKVLQALQNERETTVIQQAYDIIQKQAAKLNGESRRMYLENVPEHRAIVALWNAMQRL